MNGQTGSVDSLVDQVIDDLTSRGALAGAFSLLIILLVIWLWWRWSRRVTRGREELCHSVLITGSRGKSSTVRLLHAAFSHMGLATYAKTTGTAAEEIACDGTETPTRRLGQVSVLEMLQTMDRAFSATPPPDVLVAECMAVSPELIELISARMVHPDIVVITNAQLDHLEEEGHSEEEIAASMCSAIRPGCLVVTGEDQPGPLEVIRHRASAIGARVVQARSTAVPPQILAALPGAHPQNVAMVLAITAECGIPTEVAVAGMRLATKEPGEREVWRRIVNGLEVTYIDLGAINDPVSLLSALGSFEWPYGPEVPRLGLVNGRWDRPLRALEFAGCVQPPIFDALLVSGGPSHPVRRELLGSGWQERQVVLASARVTGRQRWGNQLGQLSRQARPGTRAAVLVSLENEHDHLADEVRSYFHAGRRVK